MELTEYIRKPFIVEAIEITEENVEDVAVYIGDVVYDDNDKVMFIDVDKNLVPGVNRVYLGFYMTRMGDHIRCYSRRVFFDQFTMLNDDIQKWVDFLEKTTPGKKKAS